MTNQWREAATDAVFSSKIFIPFHPRPRTMPQRRSSITDMPESVASEVGRQEPGLFGETCA